MVTTDDIYGPLKCITYIGKDNISDGPEHLGGNIHIEEVERSKQNIHVINIFLKDYIIKVDLNNKVFEIEDYGGG